MKPQHFAVAAGVLILTAMLLLFSGRPQSSDGAAAQSPENRVTVIGEGEVRAKPNLVRITLGVLTTDRASAAEAGALNLASAARVRDALIAAGFDAEQIDVSQPTVAAVTDQDYTGATRIAGYEARATVVGTSKNLAKLQSAIDAAIIGGATSVDEVLYQIDNPEGAMQEAMGNALANARQRAAALAKADGRTIGDLISMEMLQEEKSGGSNSPRTLLFTVRIKASFGL